MEEDINILEEFIRAVGEEYSVIREKQALESLLKAYKQDEKMIDLILTEFTENLETCPYDKYDEYLDCDNRCKVGTEIYIECWREYFRKKVKTNE